jgi:hypothetical protein
MPQTQTSSLVEGYAAQSSLLLASMSYKKLVMSTAAAPLDQQSSLQLFTLKSTGQNTSFMLSDHDSAKQGLKNATLS